MAFGRRRRRAVEQIVHHYLFRDVYECGVCHAMYYDDFDECPNCGAVIEVVVDEPDWVEEMADFDDM